MGSTAMEALFGSKIKISKERGIWKEIIINNKKIIAFCEELIEREIGISYQLPAGTRCEAINQELVNFLAKSGLEKLSLAPESGSEEIRNIIKKTK